jgi:hypothetical protein
MHSGFVSLTFVVGIVLTSAPALAQHAHDPAAPAPQHEHEPDGKMVPLFPARDASGTAWLPDTTPMYGLQRTWHGWELMLHGLAFAQFLYEPGDIHRTGGYSTHQIRQRQLGNADGQAPRRLRSCRRPRHAEWRTVDDPGLRVFESARHRRDVRGGHDSRSATSARSVHGACWRI